MALFVCEPTFGTLYSENAERKCSVFRSRTTIVWPFFVYSKIAMFQANK